MCVPQHLKAGPRLPYQKMFRDSLKLPLPEGAVEDSLDERHPHHRVIFPALKANMDINLFHAPTETMESLENASLEFLGMQSVGFEVCPGLEEEKFVARGAKDGVDLQFLRVECEVRVFESRQVGVVVCEELIILGRKVLVSVLKMMCGMGELSELFLHDTHRPEHPPHEPAPELTHSSPKSSPLEETQTLLEGYTSTRPQAPATEGCGSEVAIRFAQRARKDSADPLQMLKFGFPLEETAPEEMCVSGSLDVVVMCVGEMCEFLSRLFQREELVEDGELSPELQSVS
jgi:hypothetical protein